MKYYTRTITRREAINRFGKLGYVSYDLFIKTNHIEDFNKGLKIRFVEIKRNKVLLHSKVDEIVEIRHDLTSSEAYFRKPISKRK